MKRRDYVCGRHIAMLDLVYHGRIGFAKELILVDPSGSRLAGESGRSGALLILRALVLSRD
jgi:hypothetical protein